MGPIQASLEAVAEARKSALLEGRLQRRGNLDLLSADQSGSPEMAICHIATLLPYTVATKTKFNLVGTFEGTAAILQAAHDLNEGNGDIAPEIEGLNKRCPIRFTVELEDSEGKESISVNHVIRITDRDPVPLVTGDDPASVPPPLPCAFLGAVRSAVSIPTSIITGLRGYPQISGLSTSATLNDKSQYPLFARTVSADDDTAVAVIRYFHDVVKVKHVGVIYPDDAYGKAYVRGLQMAAQEYDPDMQLVMVGLPRVVSPEATRRTIERLKRTEFTYFFAIIGEVEIDIYLPEAIEQGIAGTGKHNWFFTDPAIRAFNRKPFAKGSHRDRMGLGTGIVASSPGLPEYNPAMEELMTVLQKWKTSHPSDLQYLSTLLPPHDNITDGVGVFDESFLESQWATIFSLYDATVGLGLSACEVWRQKQEEVAAGTIDESSVTLEGREHFDMLVHTEFNGASGRVDLSETTGTRKVTSTFFELTNNVVDETFDTTGGEVKYKGVTSSIFLNGEWTEVTKYVFNDGTTTPPLDLPPPVMESNHLPMGLRISGLILCAIPVFLAIICAGWTYKHSETRVVRASQPIFLYIVCLGAAVLALAIIPLSIDDSITSDDGCNIACRITPWMLSIGFSVVFSALFTKTYRINRIFHSKRFRRIKVTAMDVAQPMIIMLGVNVTILALWTAIAPLRWAYDIQTRDQFGRIVSQYGRCKTDALLPFLIPLGVLNLGVLTVASIQAHLARNISLEFAESDYIFRSMVSFLLVAFIGVPVLVLAQANPDAFFFVFVGIIFVTSCSVLLFIFFPKVSFLKEDQRKRRRRKSQHGQTLGFGSTRVSQASHLRSSTSEESAPDGLKILTTKSPEQLLRENQCLHAQLQALLAVAAQTRKSSDCNLFARNTDEVVVAVQTDSQSPRHPPATSTNSHHQQHDNVIAATKSSGAKGAIASPEQTAIALTSKTVGGSLIGGSGESGQLADLEGQISTNNFPARRDHSQSRPGSQCSKNERSASAEATNGERIRQCSSFDADIVEKDENLQQAQASCSDEFSVWSREE